jgi:P27 family predicted phage terminase small subunit
MAKRGRKPKPPELRIVESNAARPPAGPFATLRAGGEPPKPPTIADDPTASAEWDRVVELLTDRRVLSPADMAILALYCSAWSTVVRCRKILAPVFDPATGALISDPFTCDTAQGGVKINPVVGALSGAERSLASFASELGLTPTARGRVDVFEDLASKPETKMGRFAK